MMVQTKSLDAKKNLFLSSLTIKLQNSPSFSPSIFFVEHLHWKREESKTFHLRGTVKKPGTKDTKGF